MNKNIPGVPDSTAVSLLKFVSGENVEFKTNRIGSSANDIGEKSSNGDNKSANAIKYMNPKQNRSNARHFNLWLKVIII